MTNRRVRIIGAACLVCAIGVPVFARGAFALTTAQKIEAQQKEIEAQKAKIDKLEEDLKKLEALAPKAPAVKVENNFIVEDVPPASKAPVGTVPSAFNPSAPSGIINDISCRPKLTFYNPKPGATVPSHTTPKPGAPTDPDTSSLAPRYAYVTDPPSIGRIEGGSPWGREMYVEGKQGELDYCNPLTPITRLFFENLFATVNDGYTNIAGSANAGAGVPITQTTGNTYQAGIGYMQKPLLKQFRALLDHGGIPAEVREQGKPLEDLLFNAFTMNAGFSYGKTLTIKDGTAIQTLNSRPSYFVSASMSWNLEKMYIHLFHWGSRTADDGYYYQAPCPAFWEGSNCPQAPDAANWTDPLPPPALSN